MLKILEFLRKGWGLIGTVVAALGIVLALFAFDARYAKSEDVKQTFVEFNKSIQLQNDVFRLNTITDQLMKAKQLMTTYPNDKTLREDYKELKLKKEKLEQSIESGIKK